MIAFKLQASVRPDHLKVFWIWLLFPFVASGGDPEVEIDWARNYIAAAPLGPLAGSVSQTSWLLDFSTPLAGTSRCGLGLETVAQALVFKFSGYERQEGAPPLTRASTVAITPTLLLPAAQNVNFILSLSEEFTGAQGASLHKSLIAGGSVGIFYESKSAIKWGIGLNYEHTLDSGSRVVPFPIVDWQLSPRWKLESVDGKSGRLLYQARGRLLIFGKLEFKYQEVRLSPRSTFSSGVMRYEAYPLSLGAEYHFRPHLTLQFSVGEALRQSYRFKGPLTLPFNSAIHSPLFNAIETDYTF